MESIKEVLMRRDGMSSEEANKLIEDAREDLMSLLDEGKLSEADEICYDWFGLEPDYNLELLLGA